MIIERPKQAAIPTLTKVQQAAIPQYDENGRLKKAGLPVEMVRKFTPEFDHLLEIELSNEEREPEMNLCIAQTFNALHDGNLAALLSTLQKGDKTAIFYAFKKQLMAKQRPTAAECVLIDEFMKKEVSLITAVKMKKTARK